MFPKLLFVILAVLLILYSANKYNFTAESQNDSGAMNTEKVNVTENVAFEFHDASKITNQGFNEPDPWIGVSYTPKVPNPKSQIIPLPKAEVLSEDLSEVINNRRSARVYADSTLTLQMLANLLYYGDGISAIGSDLRTAPSAGALYPIYIYLIVNNVQNLENGIYLYWIRDHALELLISGDFRTALANAALTQDQVGSAAVIFVLTAYFPQIGEKYGLRGYRYALIECGHIAQNVLLAAETQKLGADVVGLFFDDELNTLLSLNTPNEQGFYIITVGIPDEQPSL
jgi:SagB-type dehydrogenase family enzyme